MQLPAPNWIFWRKRTNAALWECVALSCDVEPRNIDSIRLICQCAHLAGLSHHNEPLKELEQLLGDELMLQVERLSEFCTRLELALAELEAKQLPAADTMAPMDSEISIRERHVPLAAFFVWARNKMGWSLPEDAMRLCLPAEPEVSGRKLAGRAEKTYLNIIGALLELLTTDLKKQTAIINEILKHYPGVQGLAERTLQEKFALARDSLKQSKPTPP